jgi:hypothetical protein
MDCLVETKLNNTAKVASKVTGRTKVAGRVKGTPNRKTDHIFEMCEKHGFDPIEGLVLFAKMDWQALGYDGLKEERIGMAGMPVEEYVISVNDRINCMKTLVGFMYPKRKSVEFKSDDDTKGIFKLMYSNESLKPDEQEAE